MGRIYLAGTNSVLSVREHVKKACILSGKAAKKCYLFIFFFQKKRDILNEKLRHTTLFVDIQVY